MSNTLNLAPIVIFDMRLNNFFCKRPFVILVIILNNLILQCHGEIIQSTRIVFFLA